MSLITCYCLLGQNCSTEGEVQKKKPVKGVCFILGSFLAAFNRNCAQISVKHTQLKELVVNKTKKNTAISLYETSVFVFPEVSGESVMPLCIHVHTGIGLQRL